VKQVFPCAGFALYLVNQWLVKGGLRFHPDDEPDTSCGSSVCLIRVIDDDGKPQGTVTASWKPATCGGSYFSHIFDRRATKCN